jgi:formylglycine-generating enzyme
MVREGLLLVLLAGCQGEHVEAASVDAGSETTDAASETISGDCGEYRGTKMVRFGSYCIDETEVTRGDFLEMLKVARGMRNAPDWCAWNTTDPTDIDTNPDGLKTPVGYMNLCDAATFCAWKGKRLCGKINGGQLAFGEYNDAAKSEWMAVCSVNGTQTYAYAGAYDASKCWTSATTTQDVKTKPGCHGPAAPHALVYDMTGNILEWETSCQEWPPSQTTMCHTRGGEWGEDMKATCDKYQVTRVGDRYAGVGFRCCKDP